MWIGDFPRCVVIIMYKEYKAVIKIFSPTRIMEVFDHENRDTVIISSPIRLIVGGRARLVRLARNHSTAIRGKIVCSPRAIIIVRL